MLAAMSKSEPRLLLGLRMQQGQPDLLGQKRGRKLEAQEKSTKINLTKEDARHEAVIANREAAYDSYAKEQDYLRKASAKSNRAMEKMHYSLTGEDVQDKNIYQANPQGAFIKDGVILISKHELVKILKNAEPNESIYMVDPDDEFGTQEIINEERTELQREIDLHRDYMLIDLRIPDDFKRCHIVDCIVNHSNYSFQLSCHTSRSRQISSAAICFGIL